MTDPSLSDGEDEEYDDDEEGDYEDEEYEDEFVEEGDEYVGGPDLGAGAYNQNIMDGIQAKSYSEPQRRKHSRKRRKRRNRNQGGGGGTTEDGRTINDEEEDYDDDYNDEGNYWNPRVCFLISLSLWILRVGESAPSNPLPD